MTMSRCRTRSSQSFTCISTPDFCKWWSPWTPFLLRSPGKPRCSGLQVDPNLFNEALKHLTAQPMTWEGLLPLVLILFQSFLHNASQKDLPNMLTWTFPSHAKTHPLIHGTQETVRSAYHGNQGPSWFIYPFLSALPNPWLPGHSLRGSSSHLHLCQIVFRGSSPFSALCPHLG